MNGIQKVINRLKEGWKTFLYNHPFLSKSSIDARVQNITYATGRVAWNSTHYTAPLLNKFEQLLRAPFRGLNVAMTHSQNPSAIFRYSFEHLYRAAHLPTIKSTIENNFIGSLTEFIIAYYLGALLAWGIFKFTYKVWKNKNRAIEQSE